MTNQAVPTNVQKLARRIAARPSADKVIAAFSWIIPNVPSVVAGEFKEEGSEYGLFDTRSLPEISSRPN